MITTDTEEAVLCALRSGRLTVSWPSAGHPLREREFAEAFARYNGVPYCVSVDHGSSALVLALEALGIGPGDEVVVPVVTWVATATAVLRVGALPVLADVDPDTGCITPETVVPLVSPRTKAVIVVHLACTVADVDGLRDLARQADVALVEDCAQAHGAEWRGRPVGTFGEVGTFSFQQGKVLSAGEGGAVICRDHTLYARLQQLRADSRSYIDEPGPGRMEIEPRGGVVGGNYCMSELHAALLLTQLPLLDRQHRHREERATELVDRLCGELDGVWPVTVPEACTRRSIYELGVHVDPAAFGFDQVGPLAEALSAELGFAVYPPDAPLDDSPLFRPGTKRRFAAAWTPEGRRRCLGRPFPGAEAHIRSTLLWHHSVLLGTSADMSDIVTAFRKVQRAARDGTARTTPSSMASRRRLVGASDAAAGPGAGAGDWGES